MATPQSIANSAASFQGLTDKLAAIIFLLNTSNMTASQIATGAVNFQNLTDKKACIIFLLSQYAGSQSGVGSPVGAVTPTAGGLYFNTTDKTIWASDGTQWFELV